VSFDIQVNVQVRDDGEPVGLPVIEHIPLGRAVTGLDHLLAGGHSVELGPALASMIKCAFDDDDVFQAALAAIWYGNGE
jgi:hypothetical protein